VRTLLLAALLAACGGEAAPPAAPPAKGTIESLCPTDAIALFGMRSADALKPLADLSGVPTDPLPRLAALLGFDPATVDRAQPLVLAASGAGPTLTLLASVSGAYRSFATLPGGARGGCPLAAAMPEGELFARIDVKQLRELYRPMIEGLLGMVEGKAGGAGEAIALVRRLLDTGESFEAVVRKEGELVTVDAHLLTSAETVAGVKDLAGLVALLPRDFPMVAGGSAAAARLLTGLFGDTQAAREIAMLLDGGWVLGVDGHRLCLAGRGEIGAAGFPTEALIKALGFVPERVVVSAEGGIVRVSCDAEPDGSTPRPVGPLPGELAAFVRVGDAVATLSAEGRLWRLRARADPAALRAAYGR